MEETLINSSPKRCAVVTGGNKGIGFEICRQLASNDIFVILTARDEQRGTQAVDDLHKSGLPDVVYHQLDLLDMSSIAALADFILTHFKKLDILVNNAADLGLIINVEVFRTFENGFYDVSDENKGIMEQTYEKAEQTYEKAEQCLKTNYYGTKAVTKGLLSLLQLSISPNIVNVTSFYGQLASIHSEKVKSELDNVESLTEERLDELIQSFLKDFKDDKLKINGWPITVSAYKTSKAAINAYTRILACKYTNMRINCVNPGYVITDMTCNTGYSTPEEGAKGPVMVALLPKDGVTGQYFDEMNISTF